MIEQQRVIAEPVSAKPIGTLMVIDDNAVDQMIYRRIIKRSGLVGSIYPFLMAEDALEFLRRPDRGRVDIILLDINMPRMDGFEFLETATRELGEDFADMVVVMLTTSLDPRDEKKAQEFAAVKDYLNKPLAIEQLERIAKILGRRRLEKLSRVQSI